MQLPYQVVMQPVNMLSGVELFEDLLAYAESFQPPENIKAYVILSSVPGIGPE
jgi:hypothetical protein